MIIPMSERLETGLSSNSLMRFGGCIDFDKLQQMTEGDLLRINGFGRKCLNELKCIMKVHGRFLRGNEAAKKDNGWPSDRNISIYKMRRSGARLKTVGDTFGISQERVRQICWKLDFMSQHDASLSDFLMKGCEA